MESVQLALWSAGNKCALQPHNCRDPRGEACRALLFSTGTGCVLALNTRTRRAFGFSRGTGRGGRNRIPEVHGTPTVPCVSSFIPVTCCSKWQGNAPYGAMAILVRLEGQGMAVLVLPHPASERHTSFVSKRPVLGPWPQWPGHAEVDNCKFVMNFFEIDSPNSACTEGF